MKRLLGVALLLAIVATGINDVGRYFTARYNLDNVTGEIARFAAEEAKRTKASRAVVGTAAMSLATRRGVELYAYDQTQTDVTVYTRKLVEGTWVWSRLAAVSESKPATTPLYVQDRETDQIN